jgi:G3E family GTPase
MNFAGTPRQVVTDLSSFQKPILQVSGYVGAGKTTLMVATLKQLKRKRRISYVLNDGRVSGNQTVDSKRLKGLADLQTVADECFGCRNSEQLLAFVTSRLVSDKTDIIIIEGFGFTDGFEVPLLLKRRLNLETGVFTVVKVTTYNLFHHAPTFPSQIRAANLGIGITNTFNPMSTEPVKEAVGRLNSSVPVHEIKKGQSVPPHILQWLGSNGTIDRQFILGHSATNRHRHHDHDPFVFNRALNAAADPMEVMRLLGQLKGAGRIKFNLGLRHYNKTGNDPWAEPELVEDDGENNLTIYSVIPVDTQSIEHLLVTQKANTEIGNTKQTMRSIDIEPVYMTALITNGLSQLPDEPFIIDDYPLLFEESIVYLGELLHNPSSALIDDKLVRQAMNRRVLYFVQCAESALPGSKAWNNPGFALGKLYCAIAPAWFYVRERQKLDQKLVERIERLPINRFFSSGLMELTEFSPDDASAGMFLMELGNTLAYTGSQDPEIRQGLEHLKQLAQHDGRAFIQEGVNRLLAG